MASAAGEKVGLMAHWRCLVAVLIVSMCPFLQGLDYGAIGGLQAMIGFLEVFGYRDLTTPIGWNVDHVTQQLISSLMILGAFVSSGTSGFTAAYVGRKMSLWGASLLVVVATVIMQTTTSLGGLYVGRFLIGCANGLLSTHSQLYISECLPGIYRALGISAVLFWTALGGLIGTIVDNFTASLPGRACYIVPLGIIYIVPVVVSVGIFFLPESPRWLLEKDRDGQALNALAWLRPTGWAVTDEMAEMKAALEEERAAQSGVGVLDIFRNPVDRRRTLLATGAVTLQAASGSMYILLYGTYFFAMAGIKDPFMSSCVQMSVGVVAIIVNCAVTTRYGRRRVFLMSGLIVSGFTQLIGAAVYTVHPGVESTGMLVVVLIIIYLVCFNATISPYAWVAGVEMSSQRLRSHTFGVSVAVGYFWGWVAAFTAPYFINPDSLNWGPKYGYIWAPSCFFAAGWVWMFLPELKGRTFEEIDELFEAHLPARRFRQYQTRFGTAGLPANPAPLAREETEAKGTAEERISVLEHSGEETA